MISSFASSFLFFFSLAVALVSGAEHHFHWNASNPIWRDEFPSLTVRLGDRIRIFCPRHVPGQRPVFLRVFQVSEMAAMSCILETAKRQVLLCNEDFAGRSMVVSVRQRNPTPHALVFEPNMAYYWISTSSGDARGIERGMGGLCHHQNMRLRVDVLEAAAPEVLRPTTAALRTTSEAPTTSTEYDAPLIEVHEGRHLINVHHPPPRSLPEQSYLDSLPEALDRRRLADVADLARRGRTGTFRHEEVKEETTTGNSGGNVRNTWDPVSIGIYNNYKNIYNPENALYDNLGGGHDAVTYEVHEEQTVPRSYPLSGESSSSSISSSSPWRSLFFSLLLAVYVF